MMSCCICSSAADRQPLEIKNVFNRSHSRIVAGRCKNIWCPRQAFRLIAPHPHEKRPETMSSELLIYLNNDNSNNMCKWINQSNNKYTKRKNEISWYMIRPSPNQLFSQVCYMKSQQDQLEVNWQCLLHLEGTWSTLSKLVFKITYHTQDIE